MIVIHILNYFPMCVYIQLRCDLQTIQEVTSTSSRWMYPPFCHWHTASTTFVVRHIVGCTLNFCHDLQRQELRTLAWFRWMYSSFCHDLQFNLHARHSLIRWMYSPFCHDLQPHSFRYFTHSRWMYSPFCHDLQLQPCRGDRRPGWMYSPFCHDLQLEICTTESA